MELGNQIKTLRAQRGITQETLATALGVSPQAVSKWENDNAAPDIQLLPALSAYFGVTIDELFALSDEVRMERIENMLHLQKDVDPAVADREAAFLLDRARREPGDPQVYTLLSWLENHKADTCRRRGAAYAKLALERQPDDPEALSWLAYSHQLFGPYWTLADSHREVIDDLTTHIEAHPNAAIAYDWLINALLKDDRFAQAMEVCDKMAQFDHSCDVPHHQGLITWRSGDRAGALKIWAQMVRDFPDDHRAWGLYAEDYTLTGDYAGALKILEKAKELEQEPSTTYWEMGGLYEELAGNIPGAVASLEKVLEIMASWGQTEGAGVEAIRREIQRLNGKETAKT